MKHTFSFALFYSLLTLNVFSQEEKIEAISSIEGIVQELLDNISVEKGEKIDTAAVRNLFHPVAQFTVLNTLDSAYAETVSLDEFLLLLTDPYYEAGYQEKEIHKVIDEYNGIAQVFQSFYGKDSEGVEGQGINSYQLVYYQDRWWILSLLWTTDSQGLGLPEKYGGK